MLVNEKTRAIGQRARKHAYMEKIIKIMEHGGDSDQIIDAYRSGFFDGYMNGAEDEKEVKDDV